jgi:hypothetical protein
MQIIVDRERVKERESYPRQLTRKKLLQQLQVERTELEYLTPEWSYTVTTSRNKQKNGGKRIVPSMFLGKLWETVWFLST